MSFDVARKIADAVLYEGYVLYPYRASSAKNQMRWQFGVLVPRRYAEREGSEHWEMQTECLVEPDGHPSLDLRVRILQLQRRTVEERDLDQPGEVFRPVEGMTVDGRDYVTWDEGVEREIDAAGLALDDYLAERRSLSFEVPAGREVEPVTDAAGKIRARLVRQRWPLSATLQVSVAPVGNLLKLRVRIENAAPWPDGAALDRDLALTRSLIGTHTLLEITGGRFVSLLDPPETAIDAAAACVNLHTWPVLVGEVGHRGVMLSSPIILYDYPAVAAESPGELYDGTEIDEILTLRTMTLTDEEKREARGTDDRAAAILDRVDNMPPEVLERLHGAVRGMRDAATPPESHAELAPWWDPGSDAAVSPETDAVWVGGVSLSRGSRVRLRPGSRRSDAQDMFLAGRLATVARVYFDVDSGVHLAVTLDDDPAADLREAEGRYLYFAPDEVEPLAHAAAGER